VVAVDGFVNSTWTVTNRLLQLLSTLDYTQEVFNTVCNEIIPVLE